MTTSIRPNPVRAKLQAGGTAYGVMATEFYSPGFCRIAGNAGAEFVMLDMEHGGVGIDTIKAQVAFARGSGVVPFVRPPGLHYHLIAPLLDAGAMGIMVPMMETKEQAESLASWCRYRPKGVRGLGFGYAHDDYTGGSVVEKGQAENDRTTVIALIETAKGIENADAILSVEGVDMGWLGHYDLTNSMGILGQFESREFHAAVDTFLAACARHNKPAGILGTSVEVVRAWRKRGFRCFMCGTDAGLFGTALGTMIGTLAADPA